MSAPSWHLQWLSYLSSAAFSLSHGTWSWCLLPQSPVFRTVPLTTHILTYTRTLTRALVHSHCYYGKSSSLKLLQMQFLQTTVHSFIITKEKNAFDISKRCFFLLFFCWFFKRLRSKLCFVDNYIKQLQLWVILYFFFVFVFH